MNAIDLLKQDHDVVDALFVKCESTPPSRHQTTMKQIKGELETHAHIEEKIFYPACRTKGDHELQDIVAEALEEHAQMKKFVREMNRANISTEKREAKLKVLIEDTRHHVKEEEGEMFDLVEAQFSSEELEGLGKKMEVERQRFMKAKGIRASRQPQKGMVATVIDKAMGMVGMSSGDGKGTKQDRAGHSNGRSANGDGKKSSTGPAKSRSTAKRAPKSSSRSTSSASR